MARKKSYSSELARMFDTSVLLTQQIKNFQDTASGLMEDSERLHEIEPLLKDINRVAAVMSPATLPPSDQQPGDPSPGDPSPGDPSPGDLSPGKPPTDKNARKSRTKKQPETPPDLQE